MSMGMYMYESIVRENERKKEKERETESQSAKKARSVRRLLHFELVYCLVSM